MSPLKCLLTNGIKSRYELRSNWRSEIQRLYLRKALCWQCEPTYFQGKVTIRNTALVSDYFIAKSSSHIFQTLDTELHVLQSVHIVCVYALSVYIVCVYAENTHLLCKGKYHCTADLLFDWFGFSCFVELKLWTDLLVWPNPNRSKRTSAVQWYFPLQNKWVLSDVCIECIHCVSWRR